MSKTVAQAPTIEEFAKTYKPLVYYYLKKLGANAEDYEDLMQDVVFRALKTKYFDKYGKPREGKKIINFKSYVWLLVRAVYINKIKKQNKYVRAYNSGPQEYSQEFFTTTLDDYEGVNLHDIATTDLHEDWDKKILFQDFRKELLKYNWTVVSKGSIKSVPLADLYDIYITSLKEDSIAEHFGVRKFEIRVHIKKIHALFRKFMEDKGITEKMFF